MQKLTICGSFGFGNIGDEAIPLAVHDLAENLGVPINLDILSRFDKPEISSVIGLGDQDKERRESLRGQPLIMSGGGIIEPLEISTLFRCEKFLKPNFTPYASLFCISVDAGINYSFQNRWKIRRAVKNIEKIYVRDVLSEQVLRNILPGKQIETLGDLVLWLSPNESQLPFNLSLPERYIAVSLAGNWKDEQNWYTWISEELSSLAHEYDADIIFIPMSCDKNDDDREEHRRVREYILQNTQDINIILLENPVTPKSLSQIFANSFLVVAMRLHGCVMAYAQKTPFVGISYHPKIYGFVDTIEWTKAIVPVRRPEYQSQSIYGYKFDALHLEKNMLVSAAKYAVSSGKFSSLDEIKCNISKVFMEFLDNANL